MECSREGGIIAPDNSLRTADTLLKLVTNTSDNNDELKRLLVERRLQRATLALADANGLYYAAALRIMQLGVQLVDTERWDAELRNIQEIRNAISTLNTVATEHDIQYILIKEYRVVPNVARDVDIFIHEHDRKRLTEALGTCGFAILHDNPAETSLHARGSRRIDAYARIRYLGKDFIQQDLLWDFRVIHSTHGVAHPGLSPTLTLLLNSIHGLLGHPYLTLLDYLDFLELIENLGNVDDCRDLANKAGWQGLFDEWLQKLGRLREGMAKDGYSAGFPARNGALFTLRCVSQINDMKSGSRLKLTVLLNSIWDDFIYLAEKSGMARVIKSSAAASGVANQVGHHLREMRGDAKRSDSNNREEDSGTDYGGL